MKGVTSSPSVAAASLRRCHSGAVDVVAVALFLVAEQQYDLSREQPAAMLRDRRVTFASRQGGRLEHPIIRAGRWTTTGIDPDGTVASMSRRLPSWPDALG